MKRWNLVWVLIFLLIASDSLPVSEVPVAKPIQESSAIHWVASLPVEEQPMPIQAAPVPLPQLVFTPIRLPEENSRKRMGGIRVTHVVLHFSSNVTRNPDNPYVLSEILDIYNEAGASAHYLIDREGELFGLVPEDRVAFHAGKGSLPGFPEWDDALNEVSIGIELLAIGTKEEMEIYISNQAYDQLDASLIGFTHAQYETLRMLLNHLFQKYPGILPDRKHVIGHDEYASGRKMDPGILLDYQQIFQDPKKKVRETPIATISQFDFESPDILH
jgi:N-acetyl-anhydromuramyl-L-alanine amidase AmpD